MNKTLTYTSSVNTFNDFHTHPGQILDPPLIIVVQRLSSLSGRWRVNLHIQQVPGMDTHKFAPKLIDPIAFFLDSNILDLRCSQIKYLQNVHQ